MVDIDELLDSIEPVAEIETEKKKTIEEHLKPTFENVTKVFLIETLHRLLFSSEIPNFKIKFKEEEAIEFVERILQDYTKENSFFEKRMQKILQDLKSNDNEGQPVMTVNDYRRFFELLREYYEHVIELYFKRTNHSYLGGYEMRNCFEQIWLRMTQDDFDNPEEFLTKQVGMIKDNTFGKYDEETFLGRLNILDNHAIYVQNGIARTWDETNREFRIIIYDKQYDNYARLLYRPCYRLPVIRYGIYEKDGKKICYIGSVQNMAQQNEESNLTENIRNARAELNKGKLRKENYKGKIEPAKTLALSIFIDFLNKEGITEIEAPSMYVLDHEYHRKRSIKLKREFDREWTDERKQREPIRYTRAKSYLAQNYGKEDIIREIKTERFIRNLKRLLTHYPKGKVRNEPREGDSFLRLTIPKITSKTDIEGDILRDFYGLVEEMYIGQER